MTKSRDSKEHPVVILAEEEVPQRMDIAKHLEAAGFHVLQAADSDEAQALLDGRSDVSAFVTDSHLPGQIDGFALATLVREQRPEIAVVLMSGHSDASSGQVPPGGRFISKPYLFEQLVPTLRDLIGNTA